MPSELYPVGSWHPFAGGTVPAGFLLCDGAAVSRTGRADLFAVIGTTFGVGDGSTTFNLPDFRDRGTLGSTTVGTTGGAFSHTHSGSTHTHTVDQPPDHGNHSSLGGHSHNAHNDVNRTAGVTAALNAPIGTHASGGLHDHDPHSAHSGMAVSTGGSGAGGGANPRFLGMNYIIASYNTFLRTFDLAQEHDLTRTLRVRVSHAVAQEHDVVLTRKLTAFREFEVAQEHAVTFTRSLELFRTFSVAQEHDVSLSRIVTFVRSFSLAQEHAVTARVEMDFDDVPTGGGGGTTVRKFFAVFDEF